jgi:hypothetical protein
MHAGPVPEYIHLVQRLGTFPTGVFCRVRLLPAFILQGVLCLHMAGQPVQREIKVRAVGALLVLVQD